MRLAAIFDIHGNLPALEAVIHEIHNAAVDEIVVGGDVVPGPMPRETLDCLFGVELPVHFIKGNGEVAVLAERAGTDPGVPEQFRAVVRWNAEQLLPDHERLIENWPHTLRLSVRGGGEVVFCHATPRSLSEIFTCATPEERLLPIFDAVSVPLVVCGHTHMQFDRTIGRTRVVNAGSVGMPFGEPGAYWVLLDTDVTLRKTDYDLQAAASRIRASSYPQAADFASRNVLKPPSEREMLELYAGAELK